MLKKLEKGEANGILAWHPDRLARNSVDGGKIIYLLDMGKLQNLKFPTFWFENTPQGKFMLNLAFGQSKLYIDNLSENTKRGIRQKLRRGEYPGLAPIGYLNDLRTHKIVKDPERFAKVKKLFEEFATGKHTFASLAELGRSMGLTARRKKYLWPSKVREMLMNPFYCGVFRYKGEIYEGIYEPMISKSLFDKIQGIIGKRGKFLRNKRGKRYFAFKSLGMRCGECGRSITAEYKIKKSGREYHYYRCTKKNVVCSQRGIEEKQLDKQFSDLILKISVPEDWIKKMLAKLEEDKRKESKSSGSLISETQQKLQKIEEKLGILLNSYLDQLITPEEYRKTKEKLISQKLDLQQKFSSSKSGDPCPWFAPMKDWILTLKSAKNIALAGKKEEKVEFLQKVGSHYLLTNKKARAELLFPFKAVASRPPDTVWGG
jgi:DNA invertase Pin-like site-specific DNA recombinase